MFPMLVTGNEVDFYLLHCSWPAAPIGAAMSLPSGQSFAPVMPSSNFAKCEAPHGTAKLETRTDRHTSQRQCTGTQSATAAAGPFIATRQTPRQVSWLQWLQCGARLACPHTKQRELVKALLFLLKSSALALERAAISSALSLRFCTLHLCHCWQ